MTPDSIKKFAAEAAKLPGIGPRQATRIAFYLAREGNQKITGLASALNGLSELTQCELCRNIMPASEGQQCSICRDPQRNPLTIAIVEKEADVLSIEKTGQFVGRYFVLGELSKDGLLGPNEKKRLQKLKERASVISSEKKFNEIIIALNHTTYGDLGATSLIQEMKPFAKKITRLGRGLPTGGEVEFADEETLGGALASRN